MTRLALTIGGIAFLVAVATVPMFRSLAHRRRLVDDAGDDPLKIHAEPVPFVGGFGIGLGFAAGLVAVALSNPALAVPIVLIVAVGACVAALGFRDDVATVPPLVRLTIEIVAAVTLALAGRSLGVFHAGSSGTLLFVILAVLFVVGAINAVNMQDGLDGLAGGVVALSCVGFAWMAASTGNGLLLALAVSLGGAVAAFLVFNSHPASVFMGDNGSYLVGLVVGTMALTVALADGTLRGLLGAALLVGAPVFDAAFAITRRVAHGVSPFTGDRSHFYDLLSQHGLAPRSVALVCYGVQAVLVASGLALLLS